MFTHWHKEDRGFRWWLHWGSHSSFCIELALGWRFSFSLDVDDEDITIGICPAIFSLYLSIQCGWSRRLSDFLRGKSYEGRTASFKIHDWAIWLELWAKQMSWSRSDPWWMHWTWHPVDTFFGRTKHSELEISSIDTMIPMPEKPYPARVVMKRETWKRPRLPWASHRVTRAHIDCKEGIPHPGKGESEYDCGDDATYGLTCPAETVEEGIAKLVQSVLRSRRRYGGSVNWKQEQPSA